MADYECAIVACKGNLCQQNNPLQTDHNNPSRLTTLFSSNQSSWNPGEMGTPRGGKRKIGGLAALPVPSEDDVYTEKENYDPVGTSDCEANLTSVRTKVKLVLGSSKRRMSSVTECGEIEDMSGMEERLALAMTWIKGQYYEHETGSVSRSDLYDKYCRMCFEREADPMNMATLGKHIRNIFPGIITRRLGNRGNSKYHYYGLAEVGVPVDVEVQEAVQMKKRKPSARMTQIISKSRKNTGIRSESIAEIDEEEETSIYRPVARRASHLRELPPGFNYYSQPQNSPPDFDEFLRLQHEICTFAIGDQMTGDVDAKAFKAFALKYQEHTADILRKIYDREFASIEALMADFWTGLDLDVTAMLKSDACLRLVSVADDYLYQVAVSLLLPEAIEPCILTALQSIRVFAKWIDNWFSATHLSTGYPIAFGEQKYLPERLVEVKIDLARRFASILRRRTSVNHLAQAMSSVLANKSQIQQMIHDWDHVDFTAIRDQIKWIVGNKEPFVSYMEVSVKSYLTEDAAMAMWTQWLENLIEQYIAVEMASGRTLDKAVKNLLLGWSFYQTLILRDLTLRSASSFGSFHIMRLFLEEYVMYYVEKKLDEHRRAVGILAFWPTDANGSCSTIPYDEYIEQEKNGLQMMSSVADHHFPPSDNEARTLDQYSDLNTFLS